MQLGEQQERLCEHKRPFRSRCWFTRSSQQPERLCTCIRCTLGSFARMHRTLSNLASFFRWVRMRGLQLVRAPGPEQRIYETGRSRAARGGVRALAWLQHWAFACQLLFGGRSRAARRPMTRLQRLVFCIMRQGRGLSSNRHLLCEYRSVDHTFWRSCCTCLCDSLCHV